MTGGISVLRPGKPLCYRPPGLQYPEDGWAINGPFSVVIDGFSEPNSSIHPQMFSHGQTLGQVVVAEIQEAFGAVRLEDELKEVALEANQRVLTRMGNLGILGGVPREITRLVGATFAAVKITEMSTEVIVAGDAFALVLFTNGKVMLTQNQVKRHDTEMHTIIARLMGKIAQEMGIENPTEQQLGPIRKEMWNRFCPILREKRGHVINNPAVSKGYGAINGDPWTTRLWKQYHFQTNSIEQMAISTDGLVNWKMMETMAHGQIAGLLRTLYLRGGLSEILDVTYNANILEAKKMHITHAEATAIPFIKE